GGRGPGGGGGALQPWPRPGFGERAARGSVPRLEVKVEGSRERAPVSLVRPFALRADGGRLLLELGELLPAPLSRAHHVLPPHLAGWYPRPIASGVTRECVVGVDTPIALVLALASTTLVNLAYLRQHDAAAGLPALSMRRPVQSARLLLGDRRWMIGFATETVGFLLYATALALAPLALVQSVAAGGIGLLAFVSARMGRRRLAPHELVGVLLSVLGLVALAVSLAEGQDAEGKGKLVPIVLWL